MVGQKLWTEFARWRGISWIVGIQKLVVGVAESEELGNRNICRTSTLVVRRIALLVVGRKVVKKNFFFSDVAKKNQGKRGDKLRKKMKKNVLVKKYHFSSSTATQQIDQRSGIPR